MVSATVKDGSIYLYLLDTATGYVWRSTGGYFWTPDNRWELQIGETPH